MDVNIINDNSSDTGSDSVKGKFRDRLRLIRVSRFKKYKYMLNNEDFVVDRISEIDRLVDNNVVFSKKKIFVIKKCDIRKKSISLVFFDLLRKKIVNKVKNEERDRFVRGVVRRIRETVEDRNYIRTVRSSGKRKKNNELVKEQLRLKIVKNIKKNLEKKSAELEVFETELSLIKEKNDKEIDLEKIRDVKREIDVIRDKIDCVIRDYNIYRGSYDVVFVDNVGNNDVMDDIISYKDLVSDVGDDDDYKLLDKYRDLYTRLIGIVSVVDDVIVANGDKIFQLEDSDYRFYNMKNKVTIMKDRLDECDYQITRQNEYMNKLMKNINDIDKNKYTTYKFNGLNELVTNSAKYASLLMISPLAGLIPGIAINTLATRKMIKNIYKNMRIEKIDKVRYETVNYDFEIRNKLNDLDFTCDMVDDTIKMIDSLKIDMVKQFGNMNGVGDTLLKIDDIRDKVVGNRYKLDMVKKKLVVSKKINEDKLIKVKKLNNG